jgi:hypothetical protein
MKNYIIGIVLIILYSCNSNSQNVKTTESKFKKFSLVDNTDDFNYDDYKDSTVFKYKHFIIARIPNSEGVGEMIRIYKDNNVFTINDGAAYFQGLLDRFLILDLGTSATRELKIYDLNNMKVIFETTYYNYLKVKNKNIYFQAEANFAKGDKRPKCPPDRQGIIEDQFYDLTNMKLIKTGKYECTLFE